MWRRVNSILCRSVYWVSTNTLNDTLWKMRWIYPDICVTWQPNQPCIFSISAKQDTQAIKRFSPGPWKFIYYKVVVTYIYFLWNNSLCVDYLVVGAYIRYISAEYSRGRFRCHRMYREGLSLMMINESLCLVLCCKGGYFTWCDSGRLWIVRQQYQF